MSVLKSKGYRFDYQPLSRSSSTESPTSTWRNAFIQLDRHAPRLQSLFKKKASRTGKSAEVLSQIFTAFDFQEQVDVHARRAAVLRALPAYLHEDLDEANSIFPKKWDASGELKIGVLVGLLLINADPTDASVFCTEKVGIMLECKMVVESPTYAEAFVIIFALIDALHLSYPKALPTRLTLSKKCWWTWMMGSWSPGCWPLKNELLTVE